MANKKILISQKSYYMQLRQTNNTQIISSNRAGFSERTGRRIEKFGVLSSKERDWKTRKDPLCGVWLSELLPLLKDSPELKPITLFEYLEEKYHDKYDNSILRTLQRRVKDWKILSGNDKEVMFTQKHIPGQMGISDFTILKSKITIKGKELIHRIYHFRLAFSKWSYAKIILGGESFTALANGLQTALLKIGGSPKEHRTDSLSAAFNNNNDKKELTDNYNALCDHYSMKATKCNLGKSHENGSIESPHGHLKTRIDQAILMKNSNDFESIEEYQYFIDKIIERINKKNKDLIEEEKKYLSILPKYKAQDFTILYSRVSLNSVIKVKKIAYSVPSRLIGQTVKIHLFDDHLEIFYKNKRTYSLDRKYYNKDDKNALIDYRHLISSLIKKPGAFKNFIWKNELLPSDDYREIWSIINNSNNSKSSCKYITSLLHLISKLPKEKELDVSEYIMNYYYKNNQLPTIANVEVRFADKVNNAPIIIIKQRDIKEYQQLIA